MLQIDLLTPREQLLAQTILKMFLMVGCPPEVGARICEAIAHDARLSLDEILRAHRYTAVSPEVEE